MTTRYQLFLSLLVIAGLVPSTVAFAVAWVRTSRRLRDLEQRVFGPAPTRDERAERLEQAVDSLSAQMDQIVSGQEFLHRVLADRLGRVGQPRLERPEEVTPP